MAEVPYGDCVNKILVSPRRIGSVRHLHLEVGRRCGSENLKLSRACVRVLWRWRLPRGTRWISARGLTLTTTVRSVRNVIVLHTMELRLPGALRVEHYKSHMRCRNCRERERSQDHLRYAGARRPAREGVVRAGVHRRERRSVCRDVNPKLAQSGEPVLTSLQHRTHLDPSDDL